MTWFKLRLNVLTAEVSTIGNKPLHLAVECGARVVDQPRASPGKVMVEIRPPAPFLPMLREMYQFEIEELRVE